MSPPKLSTKNEILEFLETHSQELFLGSYSRGPINPPFQITPHDFFDIAQQDLRTGKKHGLVNAIGNIKRCIECQIDYLLYVFGFGDPSLNQNWNFTKRTDLLKRLNIIAPRVLEKINRRRNLLEHQYKLAKKSDVEDSLDVAALFLAYTDRFIDNAVNPMALVWTGNDKEIIEFTIDRKKYRLIMKVVSSKAKFVINSQEPEYLRALALLLDLAKPQ